MNHLKKIIIVFLLLFSQLSMGQMSNYKSLYIYHFIKRIEWPKEVIQGEFIIAVVGDKETYNALNQISKRKQNDHIPIVVNYYQDANEIENANLIFFGSSKRKNLESIIKKFDNKPILLICDKGENTKVDICLIENNDELNFIVHSQKIKSKGLKISADLIQLSSNNDKK